MMVALALELSTDTDMAAVYAAGRDDGASRYTAAELFYGDTEDAAGQVIRLSAELDNCGLYCDPMPCAGVLPALRNAGVWLHLLEAVDVAAASYAFKAAVRGRKVSISGGPELKAAMQYAVRRPLAAAFAFERRRVPCDMAPLNAAAFSLWGYRHNEGGDAEPGAWILEDGPARPGGVSAAQWERAAQAEREALRQMGMEGWPS